MCGDNTCVESSVSGESTENVTNVDTDHHDSTDSNSDNIENVVGTGESSNELQVLTENVEEVLDTSLDTVTMPSNIYAAMEIPEWRAAVMEEMKALEKNGTWEQVTLPEGHKKVGCNGCLLLSIDLMFDVKNEFLNGELEEKVYMSPPSRVQSGTFKPHHVHKESVSRKMIVLIVYVDDIVILGDDASEIDRLKKKDG
ncbi:uncharacterized protein LOC120088257 [Benincasa hispida]|uniref:uncharacterized protein LOC120088257 n=1 Tax=Benincasa hispida TaxID=102211 RepID=UPI0018FF79A9|nr:uncharacterized protein LOC120088257 [Benincasa hispida]